MTSGEYEDVEALAAELRRCVAGLMAQGRRDLLLKAVTVPVLEELRMEAASSRLTRLVVTSDFRLMLPDINREVELTPIHKAVYLLFLNHPEGITFKSMIDHRAEMLSIYRRMAVSIDEGKIEDTIDRLVNPLDNAINEKCSRIKAAFLKIFDPYTASYYIISSHSPFSASQGGRLWYRRLKVVQLPREMVERHDVL